MVLATGILCVLLDRRTSGENLMKTGSFCYYDTPNAAIHWEDEDKSVRNEWKTPVDSAGFRQVLNTGVELVTLKRAQRWLADCTKQGPVAVEDTKWATEDWTPRVIAAGIKRLAFVMPKRASSAMSIMQFITGPSGEKMHTMNFDDITEARRWLREQR